MWDTRYVRAFPITNMWAVCQCSYPFPLFGFPWFGQTCYWTGCVFQWRLLVQLCSRFERAQQEMKPRRNRRTFGWPWWLHETVSGILSRTFVILREIRKTGIFPTLSDPTPRIFRLQSWERVSRVILKLHVEEGVTKLVYDETVAIYLKFGVRPLLFWMSIVYLIIS